VNWATPIGKGDNGAVFEATWPRPLSHFMSKDKKDPDLQVVLKEVQPREKSEDALKKFMKEVRQIGNHSYSEKLTRNTV
jgi:hypothetical protein